MKKRRLLSYTGILLFFAGSYLAYWGCQSGHLRNTLLLRQFYPVASQFIARGTDLKLWLRGPQKPQAPIAVIAVDNDSLARFGRWPWRRDIIALLIHQLKQMGVKTVGVDVLFAEALNPMNEEMAEILISRKEKDLIEAFDFDGRLAQTIKAYSKDTVLEWYSESLCRPSLLECPNDNPPEVPKDFSRFSFPVKMGQSSQPKNSMLLTTRAVIPPLPRFTAVATHIGFPNVNRDADGVLRRVPLSMRVDDNFYPLFAMSIASSYSGKAIEGTVSADGTHWESVRLGEERLPIDSLGDVVVNFRGKMGTYPYIPAWKVLEWQPPPKDRAIASASELDQLRGGIAIIGATALALGDVHSTPFDPTVPGVEVFANIVDNLLSGDLLHVSNLNLLIVFLLMTVGAALFLVSGEKMEGQSFLAVVICSFLLLFAWDYAWLFRNGQNAPTGLLYLEFAVLAGSCLMFKYFAEEQKRKFIRLAFSKYVSPAVVDSLIQDPGQLSLGGRRETLSVLFADIRGFTTFSETVEAKVLSQFLNEFHGKMTDIIFEFGGTLDKYIGDAVMAFWGAPLFQPDHASRALAAAQKMAKVIKESGAEFEAKFKFRPRIGLGVHTGIVSVGNMGSERSFGYTVIGDTVNLASRLEGATKQFGVEILTSQATLKAIEQAGLPYPAHRVIGPVRTKGKSESVLLYEILSQPLESSVLESYERARAAFNQRNFDVAKKQFAETDKLRNGDGLSRYFHELCDEIAKEKLPKDWDGSWSLSEK